MLRKIIEDYTRTQHLKRGYQLVVTPNILKGKLWEVSGNFHLFHHSRGNNERGLYFTHFLNFKG